MQGVDLDEVRRRWAELNARGRLGRFALSVKLRGCRSLWVVPPRLDDWPALPWWLGQFEGVSAPLGVSGTAWRVDVDAEGRPVVAGRRRDEGWTRYQLLSWADGRVEAVEMLGDRPERLRVYALENAGVLEQVSCDGMTRLDGQLAVEVERYRYGDDGRLASVWRVGESGSDASWGPEKGPYWRSAVTRFSYATRGELVLVERFVNPGDVAHGGDREAAFLAASEWFERGEIEPDILLDQREVISGDGAPGRQELQMPQAVPPDARVDRVALAGWLVSCGLGGYTDELMRSVEPGIRLERASGERRSRLGGPALLPPGVGWPHTHDGRPLAFLAAIDLGELPPMEPLPHEGWMLFYADTATDGLGAPLVEPAPNREGSRARMWHVGSPDIPVLTETPPGAGRPLGAAFVDLDVQLTLPDDTSFAQQLGLDEDEEERYSEIAALLRFGDDGWSTETGSHWILGAWTNIQGHPRDGDSVALLHMASDESIGFDFLGGGALQFLTSRDALVAGDWSAVVAEPGLP